MTKVFGSTKALDRVALTVQDRESHALVGRNGAGKSTLVSILTGLQTADDGEVRFRGAPAPSVHDRDRWRQVVACVYQKSTIIPTLTVAENLFLNRQRMTGPVINWRALRVEAQAMLDEWAIGVDVRKTADSLTVEQRQMVEIARALSFGARFIILDEPTAQLDPKGVARLFDRLRMLQGQGVSLLYISHHLQEIFEICQTVTVFRDARHVLSEPVADLSTSQLVDAMTGEVSVVTSGSDISTAASGAPVLTIDGLSGSGAFHEISLTVQAGEVVGITGSGSSGRIAFAETLVGLRKPQTGTIAVGSVRPRPGNVASALAAGIGFVPRDRHHEGLVESLSLAENITMTVPKRLGRWGFAGPKRRRQIAAAAISDLSVVASGPDQLAGSLSGGNQQKIVMGRALANDPKVLVLMHPTAGVDVRSKATLMAIVDRVRAAGTAVVIVSDELDDLRPCDRVLVMVHGRIALELQRGWQDSDVVSATEGIGADDD